MSRTPNEQEIFWQVIFHIKSLSGLEQTPSLLHISLRYPEPELFLSSGGTRADLLVPDCSHPPCFIPVCAAFSLFICYCGWMPMLQLCASCTWMSLLKNSFPLNGTIVSQFSAHSNTRTRKNSRKLHMLMLSHSKYLQFCTNKSKSEMKSNNKITTSEEEWHSYIKMLKIIVLVWVILILNELQKV